MLTFTRNRVTWALALLALCAEVPALAGTFGGMLPVANQQLDQVRGGFSLGFDFGRIAIALNMNRLSFVNGILTSVAPITGEAGGTLNLIQTGPSVVVSQPPSGGAPTVGIPPAVAGAAPAAPLQSVTPPGGTPTVVGMPSAPVAPVVPGAPVVETTGGSLTAAIPVLSSPAMTNAVSSSIANSLPAGTIGTVIQNSLDGQMIQSINVLNITVTSQALAQAVSLQSFTQGALLRFMH